MTTLNIQKRKIYKRRRDGQVAQGSSVSTIRSISSSESPETGNLQDYAKKIDVHVPSQKPLLDVLSIDAGYFKYNAAGVSVENADKLGGIVASAYWKKSELVNDALYLKIDGDKIKAGYADLAYNSDRLGNVLAANYARKDTANTYQYAQTINADLYVNGNIIQNGSAYETHAEHLNVESNLMQLNIGEPGSQITGVIPGTSIAFSGIEINRGSADPYYMGVVEGAKPLLKLGKKNSLEAIATRADSITDGYAIEWDDSNKRMIGVAAVRDSLKLGGRIAADFWHKDNSNLATEDWAAKNVIASGGVYSGNSASYITWMSGNAFNFKPTANATAYIDHYRPTQTDGVLAFRSAYNNTNHIYMLKLTRTVQYMYSSSIERFQVNDTGTKTTGNHIVSGAGSFVASVTAQRFITLDSNTNVNKLSRTGGTALYVQQGDTTSDLARFYKGSPVANAGTLLLQIHKDGFKLTGEQTTTGNVTVNSRVISKEHDSASGARNTIAYQFYEGRGWGYNSANDAVFYNAAGGNIPWEASTSSITANKPHYFKDILQGTGAFVSGFSGSNWQIGGGTDKADATFDNLTVRKSMNVYELNLNKIRSGNGSYWFSDGARVVNVQNFATYWTLWVNEDLGQPFRVGDVVRCQNFDGRNIKYYTAQVTWIGGGSTLLAFDIHKTTGKTGSGIPEIGDEIVRMGNVSDTNRQGALYITSNDNNAPYLDVLDGINSSSLVNKTKVRLGRLDGITDADLGGTLSGYGLYAENAYLKGKIVAKTGKIGGWNIDATKLYTTTWGSVDEGMWMKATADDSELVSYKNTSNYTKLYNSSSTNWGIAGIVDGKNIFQLGSTNKIAGWNFDSKYLWNGSKYGAGQGVEISNDAYARIMAYRDSNNLVNVYYASTSSWGIQGVVGGTNIFQLGSTNQIAGLLFDSEKFTAGNVQIWKTGDIINTATGTPYAFYGNGNFSLGKGQIGYNAATNIVTLGSGVKMAWTSITGTSDINNRVENGLVIIPRPKGGSYSNTSGAETGVIKVTLPQSWTNSMVDFTVDVYNYNTSTSFSVKLSGYNYVGSGGTWISTSAVTTGTTSTNVRVRFGHDGTKCCIYIGENNSNWSYAKVGIKDFQCGYGGVNIDYWNDGWGVGITPNVSANIDKDYSSTLVASGDTLTVNSAKVGGSTLITNSKIRTTLLNVTEVQAAIVQTSILNADKITTGTLSANRIGALSITGDKIAAGTITTTKLAAATITAEKIATGTITADKLAANVLTAQYINFDNATGTNMDISGKISATISGLQTTILDGSNIYESVENYDTGLLSINVIGYGGGTTKYRSTRIGNGKGGVMLFCSGADDEITVKSGKFTVDHALKVDGVATLNNGLILSGSAIVTGAVSVTTNFVENGVLLSDKYASKYFETHLDKAVLNTTLSTYSSLYGYRYQTSHGWCRLPNGMIMNWGKETVASNSISNSIYYKKAFTTSPCTFSLTPINTDLGNYDGWAITNETALFFKITNAGSVKSYYWIAIGY